VTNNSINLAKFDNEDSIVAQGSPNACGQVISFTTSASGKWVHAKANNYSSQPAADSVNMIASIEDNANYGTFYASYYTSSATRLMPSGKTIFKSQYHHCTSHSYYSQQSCYCKTVFYQKRI